MPPDAAMTAVTEAELDERLVASLAEPPEPLLERRGGAVFGSVGK